MATAYQRIIVPKDPTRHTEGTYDLRLTANFRLDSNMNSVPNPVFSYRGNGKLYIFSKEDQTSSCSYLADDEHDLWEWSFPVSPSQLSALRNYLIGIVDSYVWNTTLKCYVCTLKSPQSNYQLGAQDSYKETAVWCQKQGVSALLNRFDNKAENSYLATLPSALELSYVAQGAWQQMEDGHDLPC